MTNKSAKEFFEYMMISYIAEIEDLETYKEEWTDYDKHKYEFITDEINDLKKFISKEFE
jgi:hypothetical protein